MKSFDLASLFREQQKDLLRFVRARLGKRQAAAPDLVHDAFMKLHALAGGIDIRDERAFLFRIAANLAKDHLRVERRRQDIMGELSDVLGAQCEDITPERHAEARSELEWVIDAFQRMPLRQRMVLYRYHIEGYTQAEVAEEFGIVPTTVRADLRAAIGALVDARRRVHRQGKNRAFRESGSS
ncbi:MAG: RNA polymerase sigma factor [Pseudomonadota bacterium]